MNFEQMAQNIKQTNLVLYTIQINLTNNNNNNDRAKRPVILLLILLPMQLCER